MKLQKQVPVLVGSVVLTVLSLTVSTKQPNQPDWLNFLKLEPAVAQIFSASDAWQQVYVQLPDFPKENQYVNIQTGQVSPNNTLASRLIRYHVYVKGRAPYYRLDWKLTLADYLGVHDFIEDSQYPGRDALKTNPFEGDRAAIRRLNRTQREALVQALVNIFNNPGSANQPTPSQTTPRTPSNSTVKPGSPLPPKPKPGDAQLLLP